MRGLTLQETAILAAGLFLGCGSSGLPSITPSVKIDSPANNSTVNLPANKQIAVNFSTNYTLKAKGACAGLEHCGHIYVLVDNTNCNQPKLPYNTIAVASPVQVDLGLCMVPTGTHTITLELHNDDESAVRSLIGSPVTDSVTINAQ